MKKLFMLIELVIVLFTLTIISSASLVQEYDSIASIEVEQSNVENTFTFNDFDISKIYLIINNNDGTTQKVALTREMISDSDAETLSTVGRHNINIKFKDHNIDLSITIIDNRVNKLLEFVYSKQETELSFEQWTASLSTNNETIIAAGINKDGSLILTLASNEIVNAGKAFEPSEPISKIEEVEVTLLSNGGSLSDDTKLKTNKGSTVLLPNNIKVGYDFLGWYAEEKLYTNESIINSNITLKAKWKIKTYLVEFIDNTTNQIIDKQMVNHGEIPNIPFIYKNYYTFIGFDPRISTITCDTQIMVIYIANKFALIFNSMGGNEITPLTLEETSIIDILPVPIKEGCIFQGWYLDADYNDAVILPLVIKSNLNLYTKWGN